MADLSRKAGWDRYGRESDFYVPGALYIGDDETPVGEGSEGPPGQGVPTGGIEDDSVRKLSGDDFDTEWGPAAWRDEANEFAEPQTVRATAPFGLTFSRSVDSLTTSMYIVRWSEADGILWGLDTGEKSLLAFDPVTLASTDSIDLGDFLAVDFAVAPDGTLYVIGNLDGDQKVLTFAADGTPGPVYPLGFTTAAIAIASDGVLAIASSADRHVHVTDDELNELEDIDLDDVGQNGGDLPAAGAVTGLAFDGERVVVAGGIAFEPVAMDRDGANRVGFPDDTYAYSVLVFPDGIALAGSVGQVYVVDLRSVVDDDYEVLAEVELEPDHPFASITSNGTLVWIGTGDYFIDEYEYVVLPVWTIATDGKGIRLTAPTGATGIVAVNDGGDLVFNQERVLKASDLLALDPAFYKPSGGLFVAGTGPVALAEDAEVQNTTGRRLSVDVSVGVTLGVAVANGYAEVQLSPDGSTWTAVWNLSVELDDLGGDAFIYDHAQLLVPDGWYLRSHGWINVTDNGIQQAWG